ncbi:MAG: NAD-dependent epimerase/dehydratase family protein [Pirellulaceae bacterium]
MNSSTSSSEAVVVTGAAGHVGENLIRELAKQGRRVRAIQYRRPIQFKHPLIEIAVANLQSAADLDRVFANATAVYHLAAVIPVGTVGQADLINTNVEGTRNVDEACRRQRVPRLVHFSSIHAFDPLPINEPINESRSLVQENSGFVYDRSKAMGERVVLEAQPAGADRRSTLRVENPGCHASEMRATANRPSGLDVIILNPTGIIGPYDFRPSAMGRVIQRLMQGEMRFLVSGGFDWVDVRDVVAAAICAEQSAKSGERFILSGTWLSVADLAHQVDEIVGRRRWRVSIPASLATGGCAVYAGLLRLFGVGTVYTPETVAILQQHRFVSSAKAVAQLGFNPRPLHDTLRDTIDWFRS